MKKVLDLSEHNGSIDFKKVKEAGITDIILRVGWIGNKVNHTLDKKFLSYYKEARTLGFNIGAYVYSYCKNLNAIESGCNWLFNQIKTKSFELPIFLDLEDETISILSKADLTNHAVKFCKYFEAKGYKSGVYASKYWFLNKLTIQKLLDYTIWLAEWTTNNNHTLGFKVDLWQYTDKGKVKGINTNVDISKCLCKCIDTKENTKKEEFEMPKTYKNGSTTEVVYADSNCSIKIGSLNPYEQCECLGTVNNRYIVKYKIDLNKNNYKVGFVKYSGGIKN